MGWRGHSTKEHGDFLLLRRGWQPGHRVSVPRSAGHWGESVPVRGNTAPRASGQRTVPRSPVLPGFCESRGLGALKLASGSGSQPWAGRPFGFLAEM